MIYKIVEISTDKASGHTYVLVHFWWAKADFDAAKPPDRKNDFLMQLRPTGVRIVTDGNGWYKRLSDGKFIDPETLDLEKSQPEWERETYDRALPAEMKANIEAYWQRAEGKSYPTDHADSRIERDNSDPHGVLARPEVTALRGITEERLTSPR